MVCGIDLVKWQIRAADGEALDFTQNDVKQRGHSIECRVYAEDPSRDFLPTPGLIRKMILPEGSGIRNDVGVSEGQEVTSDYDPLLAKVVVWDSCRNSAINRMDYALSNFVILGLVTNQPFLRDIMNSEAYRKASFTTRFVDEHFSGWEPRSLSPEVIATALLASKSAPEKVSPVSSRDPYSPWNSKGTWRQNI